MRKLLVLPISLLITISLAGSASAQCLAPTRLGDIVQRVDAVWYGTVTEAYLTKQGGSGLWLTVRLLDVLKGPEEPGETVTVYFASCAMGPGEDAASMAPDLMGKARLFYGGIDKSGSLLQFAGIVVGQGWPVANHGTAESVKYGKAAAALGVEPDPSLTGETLIDGGAQNVPVGASPPLGMVALVVVTLLLGAGILAALRIRRRRDAAAR